MQNDLKRKKGRLDDLLVHTATTTTQPLDDLASKKEMDNNSVKRRRGTEENQEERTAPTITTAVGDESLYSMLRCWTRDEPLREKERMERESNAHKNEEKPMKMNKQMDNVENIHLLIAGEKVLSEKLFQNTKFSRTEAQQRLLEHVHRFKKIRNRSKLVVASRYSRLRDQFAAKQIPPLAALEIILEDCQALSSGPLR